jgi:hypothetical protein
MACDERVRAEDAVQIGKFVLCQDCVAEARQVIGETIAQWEAKCQTPTTSPQ